MKLYTSNLSRKGETPLAKILNFIFEISRGLVCVVMSACMFVEYLTWFSMYAFVLRVLLFIAFSYKLHLQFFKSHLTFLSSL